MPAEKPDHEAEKATRESAREAQREARETERAADKTAKTVEKEAAAAIRDADKAAHDAEKDAERAARAARKGPDPMSGLPEMPDPSAPEGDLPPVNPSAEVTRPDAERALARYRHSSPTGPDAGEPVSETDD